MDIHGEDTYGFGRENQLLFRPPMHMYNYNDFTKMKEMEDIDALSKHVIMKGLNEDDPTSSLVPPSHLIHLTPPNHTMDHSLSSMKDGTSSSLQSLALKLEGDEDEGELAGSFAFFKKPQLNQYNQLNHSVDDLLPANHHNNNLHLPQPNKHDFVFLQPFEQLRSNGKHATSTNNIPNGSLPQYSHHNNINNHTNNVNNITHDNGNKNTDSSLISPSPSMTQATIINNINHINNINNISNINHINNINNINHINTYNTINNSININININPNNKDDMDSIDDKSAIQLINSTNGNSLEVSTHLPLPSFYLDNYYIYSYHFFLQ